MNWEAIGAVVEILSAAFVLIALVYLATRVKYAKNAAADTNRLKISTNSVAFICRTMAALPLSMAPARCLTAKQPFSVSIRHIQ